MNSILTSVMPIRCRILALAMCAAALLAVGCQQIAGRTTAETPAPAVNPTSGIVAPFENIAETALSGGYEIWNDRPGVAVFDYDRDGDLDMYFTSHGGEPNRLYRNDGAEIFTDVAEQAGVAATESHSTGAAACDLNNDGYQDLYVGAWGNPDDDLGFRSPQTGNRDSLFLNNGNGTFTDITDAAFGDAANLRSATSIACADVNNDGWLDIYVGNLLDDDFRTFADYHHPGHYNLLYINNGDLTFTEVGESAGVRGAQIRMPNPDGSPVTHTHAQSGETFVGYDPNAVDAQGNPVGEPTGQTHAVAFLDYDADGDPDLLVANDGDSLHLFRNDTAAGRIRFTPMARPMGIDIVGSWMGFAVGDYDADADLDVFVTNAGFHPLLQAPAERPRGNCEYAEQFAWGTCAHFLLRNDDGGFVNVAPSIAIEPSPWMPPASLDSSVFHPSHNVPTGIAAYDFGFGATFFDYDNDGYQDLYWLGSTAGRGEGPRGQVFPSAGRMLRNTGDGFEDVTVRAHLLDIARVNYADLNAQDPAELDAIGRVLRRIDPTKHENGKGVAHGDMNGDGYVDLIATNSSGLIFTGPYDPMLGAAPTRQAPGPVFLWMNRSSGNNWLTLRLKGRMAIDGTGSNADGVGARILLTTSGDAPQTQVQEVHSGSSYLSMDSVDLEFGIGSAQFVDTIRIHWPSGTMQIIEDLEANQILDIIEPAPQQ